MPKYLNTDSSVDFGESSVLPPPKVTSTGQLENIAMLDFGNPDTVLKATEELRGRDRNQEQFVSVAGSNAGILPLAHEDPGALNLFPPLRPAKRIPK